MKHILFIFFLITVSSARANLDSLWSVWSDQSEPDTSRLKAMKNFAWKGYLFTQPDSAFYFAQLHFDLAKEVGDKKHMATALNTQGISLYFRGEYDEAIECYTKSLSLFEEIEHKKGVANAYNNIGIIHLEKGDFNQAIEFYIKSLHIREEIGDKKGIASSLGNIGIIYQEQGGYAKSIEYHARCLKIDEELGNKKGVANSFGNIGVIYDKMEDYPKAIEYVNYSLNMFKEIGDKQGVASSLNSIGSLYKAQGRYNIALRYFKEALTSREELGDKNGVANSLNSLGSLYIKLEDYEQAMEYYEKSLDLYKEIEDKSGVSNILNNIGSLHLNKKEYSKAIKFNSKALLMAEEIGVASTIKTAANCLYESYKATGKYKLALEMHELFLVTRDSLESEENRKEVIRQEYKYSYEKQAAEDSVVNEEEKKVKDAMLKAEQIKSEKSNLEVKHQKEQAYYLYGVLAIALLFGAFIFNRFRVTNKQKGIIEEQKLKVDSAFEELEEKNTEIMDSINYAKRIQSAILPPDKVVKEYLKESFVLYKPKDIVAGDFYWLEYRNGKVLFAAADCTGHGVPGAMVSVVCNNGLNRSVREENITDPGRILDKTREIVVQEFEKSEDEVKDGMDIALCSLEVYRSETGEQQDTKNKEQETVAQLQYAGAHNPLWVIRNFEIIEIKANKQPIGKFDNPQPYKTHSIELQKGDTIYIFTDGYADQFGGEKGKKLKSKEFKNILLSIQNESMDRQLKILDDKFETWRGSLEQIDDVCIIGVKI